MLLGTQKKPTSRQSATLQTPLQTAIVFIKSYDSQSYRVLVTSFAQLDVQSLLCDIEYITSNFISAHFSEV